MRSRLTFGFGQPRSPEQIAEASAPHRCRKCGAVVGGIPSHHLKTRPPAQGFIYTQGKIYHQTREGGR